MGKQNVISMIEGSLPTLSGAYHTIGSYILEHRYEVPSMSTEELASACNVSEATIVRFARTMGATGYRDFKISLSAANAVREHAGLDLADIRPDDTPAAVANKLTAYTISSLESTGNVLDHKELEHAVDIIDKAYTSGHKLYLAGLGASGTVARAFSIKLMRLDIPTVYYEDFHLQLEAILNIKPGDVLVCFTVLGRSIENEQLINIARKRGCDVILITQRGMGGIAKKATCLLLTSCVESKLRLASQTGLIVQMLIVDVLFTSLALRHLDVTRASVTESKRTFIELGHYSM